MEDNLKYSKHKDLRDKHAYRQYDNYDAVEVPYTDAIPSDYMGVMGVPISFLDKHCVEQYDVVGVANHGKDHEWDLFAPRLNGRDVFKRLLIRKKER